MSVCCSVLDSGTPNLLHAASHVQRYLLSRLRRVRRRMSRVGDAGRGARLSLSIQRSHTQDFFAFQAALVRVGLTAAS